MNEFPADLDALCRRMAGERRVALAVHEKPDSDALGAAAEGDAAFGVDGCDSAAGASTAALLHGGSLSVVAVPAAPFAPNCGCIVWQGAAADAGAPVSSADALASLASRALSWRRAHAVYAAAPTTTTAAPAASSPTFVDCRLIDMAVVGPRPASVTADAQASRTTAQSDFACVLYDAQFHTYYCICLDGDDAQRYGTRPQWAGRAPGSAGRRPAGGAGATLPAHAGHDRDWRQDAWPVQQYAVEH